MLHKNCSSHEGIIGKEVTSPTAEPTVLFEEVNLLTVL